MPFGEGRAEKRYQALFELSPYTIMTFSRSGIVTSCNKAMETLTGYPSEDMVGKHFLKLNYLGREAVSYGLNYLPKILRGEPIDALEIPFISKRGEKRWAKANIKLLRYSDGRHEIVAIVEDITESKNNISAEARFMAFKEAATDGFLIMDKNFNILDANPTWVKRARAKGQIIGKHITEVLAPTPDAFERMEVYKSVAETGKPREFDNINAPSGIGLLYNIKAFKVGDGVGLIVRNITDRVRAEEEQFRLREELLKEHVRLEQAKELSRLKTEFMNTATHEIRTPISSIQGYTELIWDALKKGNIDLAFEFFGVVERNIIRLRVLSDDLLDMLRFNMDKITLNSSEVLLSDLFNELETAIYPLIIDNKHLLIFNSSKDCTVWCDQARIMQVLFNLVTNAIKYNPDGGKIKVSATKTEGDVIFSVVDYGIGLSGEDLGKLFNPFPEIDNRMVRHGTGLGLSICKGIVDLHGGEIWVESEGHGHGSVFIFTIPVHNP